MDMAPEPQLALVITSYQRLSPSVVSSQTFSTHQHAVLGRSPECDWHLPDPERVISSRHSEIFCRNGQFYVRDISTNGLFLNDARDPLGEGNEAALNPGDRLRLGDYELAVTLSDHTDPAAMAAQPSSVAPSSPPAEAHSGPALAAGASTPGRLAEVPAGLGSGGNPTLASGLGQQRLGDSHVDLPRTGIPESWQWQQAQAEADGETGPGDQQLKALLNGLGLSQLELDKVTPAMLESLGELTRLLLERLQGLLRTRAEQKQQLRVQQTLFRRQENNPLKFSASAADALDALLLRRHDSFLAPRSAVEEAFDDLVRHEQALLAGVEAVVADLLAEPYQRKGGLWGRGRQTRAQEQARRRQYREDYGDSQRMMRSDAFVEAYENTCKKTPKESHS